MNNDDLILKVENLNTKFWLRRGLLHAVNDVSFDIKRGGTFGMVGESGCGKSVTAMSLVRLNPSPPAISEGTIIFNGEGILQKSEREMRDIRGGKISMIFQEPMTCLNPVFTVGEQIAMGLRVHKGLTKKEAKERAIEMMELVKIPSARERVDNYPHEFSGGMRQRVMLAMALSCDPILLIADEPTTALDVTIQAVVLDLINDMIHRLGMSLIFISHDLFVVGQMCDDIAVMYASHMVEYAKTDEIFDHPLHPYTVGLLNSIPRPDEKKKYLEPIKGNVCNMLEPPSGCKYHPRCPHAFEPCAVEVPQLREVAPGHFVACHLF